MSDEVYIDLDVVIISTSDLMGNIVDCNFSFREISGYDDYELQGKPHSILRHPDVPKEVFQDLWKTIQSGKPWYGVLKNRCKNGNYYWVRSNVSPIIKNKKIIGYLSVRYPASRDQIIYTSKLYADIKIGKSVFPSTLSSQKEIKFLYVFSASILSLLPLIHVLYSIELPWYYFLGYILPSILGISYLSYYTLRQDYPSSLLVKSVEDLANGQFREPIQDYSYWGFALNMIRSRLGEAYARLYDKIKKESESKIAIETAKSQRNFLISMSHELRTPLNGMLSMSQLLYQETTNPIHRNQAQVLNSSTHQLAKLIYNVLDYSNLESNQLMLRPAKFDLESWLHSEVLITHLQIAKEKGLGYFLEIESNVPFSLIGDRERLAQVLNNVINNAMKFTNKGKVVVNVSSRLIDLNEQSVSLIIKISDTGCGLSKEEIDDLFKPFSQINNSGKKNNCGVGLGLVVSERLINMMQGSINVYSNVGKGSVFEIKVSLLRSGDNYLTKIRKNVNYIFSQHRQEFNNISNVNILVVEDIFINQEVILGFLKVLHIDNVIILNNGKDFLDFIGSNRFSVDIVLMDCLMPVLDGYEATRAWRNIEKLNDMDRLPIIALTANAALGDAEACYDAGMDDYLTKPINIELLRNCLLHWYSRTASSFR